MMQPKDLSPSGLVLLTLTSLLASTLLGAAYSSSTRRIACKPQGAYGLGTFEHGFSTEQILPTDFYELERREFTGKVEFLADRSEVLILPSSEPSYVGDASPAIDAAWNQLVEGRYWSIAEDEAKMLWGAGYQLYRDHIRGGYTGGFDVFHMLHCLNMIRKRLDPEYYKAIHYGGLEHDMHCIDQIRQRLQCSATCTINPARYSEELGGLYVDSAQSHTCRNFKKLWLYTRARYNGSLAAPRTQWHFRDRAHLAME